LVIVLAEGPLSLVLSFLLYPIIESQIWAIPIMITGWLCSAALSGLLLSKCVREYGPRGYAIALVIGILLLLPFVGFVAFIVAIG